MTELAKLIFKSNIAASELYAACHNYCRLSSDRNLEELTAKAQLVKEANQAIDQHKKSIGVEDWIYQKFRRSQSCGLDELN
ncbi:MAG: hypothetical protein HC899_37240 [Leptolyngbyaceae cyanobacterium SM1_4_3]|nr:hypothetical protein [Leptolyngbyaceae cyanobacterium SM1_4_3]